MKKLLAACVLLAVATTARAQQPALDSAEAGPADRIWSANPNDQDVWLRRPLALPEQVDKARMVFTCDDECRVFVNGREVATATAWMDVTVVDLEQLGRDNVIAVAAKNTGGPGAFACWILWQGAKGESHELISDASWRATTAVADIVAGWDAVGFNDNLWQAATASFTSTFGRNLYNGAATQIHFRNRHSAEADAIGDALQRLRQSLNRASARRALDAIEHAVMQLRSKLWREQQAEKQARK